MFAIIASSLTMALGLSAFAVEFPAFQNVLFVGAAVAAMAFCCALEVWSSEAPADAAPSKPEPHEAPTEEFVVQSLKKAA